jgi:hypothetical protein
MTQIALPKLRLSRAQRHALVLAQYALLTAGAALALALGYTHPVGLVTFLLVALLSAASHTVLAMSIDNIAQVRPHVLDERQRLVRDRAFAAALRVLTVYLSVGWVYALLASLLGWWLPPADRAWFALWTLAMLAYGLPTALAAWHEPEDA